MSGQELIQHPYEPHGFKGQVCQAMVATRAPQIGEGR